MPDFESRLNNKRKEYKKLLDESLKRLVEKLSGKVDKISLFGSYVRSYPHGKADLFTDLDILIIGESDKPFIERLGWIHSYLTPPVDADILWYTPEEFEKIKDRGFIRNILKDEIVLYERKTEIKKD